MKVYIQFKSLSTGYPTFKEQDRKPIDMLGSDGVAILDGRKNISSLREDALSIWSKRRDKNSIIGFEIIRASSFLDKGNIISTFYKVN